MSGAIADGAAVAAAPATAPARQILVGRVLLGIALLALWFALSAWLGPAVIADPAAIVRRLAEIGASGLLFRHAGITLMESAIGLALGGMAGFALPFGLRLLPRLEAALEPFIGAAMGVPKLALAPLIILWFGIGLASKVAFVSAVVFFLIFFSTLAGIRAADPRLLAVTRVFGAGRWLTAREVLLPGAMPFVLASLKVAAPRAISAAVVGEFLASDRGLGYYISDATNQADTVGVFAGVVAITVVVVAVNALIERWQRHALAWRATQSAHF